MSANRPWYDLHQRKLSKRLYSQVAARDPDEPIPVIVMAGDRGIGEIRRRVLELDGRILRELPIIGGFSTILPAKALSKLVTHPDLQQLHHDRDARLGWGELAAGGLEIHEVCGTHADLMTEPYVQMIAEKLASCLLKAQAEWASRSS